MMTKSCLYLGYAKENAAFLKQLQKLDQGRYFYLAGPYTGPTALYQKMNVAMMQAYHHMLASHGFVVIATPIMCSQYDYLPHTKEQPHEFWINQCKKILLGADACLVMPNSGESKGVKMEIDFCKERKIPTLGIPELNYTTINQTMQLIESVR